ARPDHGGIDRDVAGLNAVGDDWAIGGAAEIRLADAASGGNRGRRRGRGQKPPARQGDAHGHGNPPVIRMRRAIITEPGRLCDNAGSHHEVPWRGADRSTASASSSSSTTRSPFGAMLSPPNRARATSRMRSAMRGSRSMRTWRSWASSINRLVRVTAVTVADRRVRRLAEEMTGTQPNTFVLELNLYFPRGDEIHGMRGLAAPG